MMRVSPLACLLFFVNISALQADTTIVDVAGNYSVYLPNHWVRDPASDSQHYFYDTTFLYPALLSLRRYAIDTTIYSSGEEWTSSHFIAYKLSVGYSIDPAGVVLYSNEDSTVRQGSLQAAEAYSVFFSYDTSVGAWAEYVRYTACKGYGYELYAIGDTADMSANVGYYAAILQSIRFLSVSRVVKPLVLRAADRRATNAASRFFFDPLGREIYGANLSRRISQGIYFRKKTPPSFFLR